MKTQKKIEVSKAPVKLCYNFYMIQINSHITTVRWAFENGGNQILIELNNYSIQF